MRDHGFWTALFVFAMIGMVVCAAAFPIGAAYVIAIAVSLIARPEFIPGIWTAWAWLSGVWLVAVLLFFGSTWLMPPRHSGWGWW